MKKLNIVSIVGARPQFIKCAPLSTCLRNNNSITETLIHTGQHYDENMSQVFFDEMEIPMPDIELEIGSGPHGAQTGKMLEAIEKTLLNIKPDGVIVFGDTNSTLAGALAAVKLHYPLAHIEAGLRSFNRKMPEEINRILTDHCSSFLFCPTQSAVQQLSSEGINNHVHFVGDTMYEAVMGYTDKAARNTRILKDLQLESKEYILATVHRPQNTDCTESLKQILDALAQIDLKVIFPVHPRTRKIITESLPGDYFSNKHVKFIDPVGYLEMLLLQQNARVVITDSGGMQKEAYFLGVPCVTLRDETEWMETVNAGWNILAGNKTTAILEAVKNASPGTPQRDEFGDGNASQKIVDILINSL